jgi:hypothetical protein
MGYGHLPPDEGARGRQDLAGIGFPFFYLSLTAGRFLTGIVVTDSATVS